jgi:outer membrane cobalamin receptor
VKSAVPGIAGAVALALGSLVAQAADSTSVGEVVITATRTATPVDELAVPVIVITRAEIERSLAGDVASLLAGRPGLEIARTGGPGQPAAIFLRGTDSDHTTVLIDGVRINPGTIGGAALQNIQPESIERIEIIKGARASLYGTDAIGGVINIITRAGAAQGASLYAAAGRYGTQVVAGWVGASPRAAVSSTSARTAFRRARTRPTRATTTTAAPTRSCAMRLTIRLRCTRRPGIRAASPPTRISVRRRMRIFSTPATRPARTGTTAPGAAPSSMSAASAPK